MSESQALTFEQALEVAKAGGGNPNHDERGRFSSGGGGDVGAQLSGAGYGVRAMQVAYNNIPAEHTAGLAGVEFNSVDLITQNGKTWAGLAILRTKTSDSFRVIVADSIKGRDGAIRQVRDIVGVTTHEIGHVLDFRSGLRLSRAIHSTVMNEAKGLNPQQAQAAKYFLAKPTEMYAEAYRLVYAASRERAFGMPHAEATKAFPKTIAAVRAMKLKISTVSGGSGKGRVHIQPIRSK